MVLNLFSKKLPTLGERAHIFVQARVFLVTVSVYILVLGKSQNGVTSANSGQNLAQFQCFSMPKHEQLWLHSDDQGGSFLLNNVFRVVDGFWCSEIEPQRRNWQFVG